MRMSERTHSGTAQNITTAVSKASAPHYTWASICYGWRLIDTPGLSVVEERVPPGAGEVRHYHNEARQFFYVLFRHGRSGNGRKRAPNFNWFRD
jgi:hypothetical protein